MGTASFSERDLYSAGGNSGKNPPRTYPTYFNTGLSASVSKTYTQLGSISAILNPSMAQWRIDGGAWQSSSTTVYNVSLGSHTIDYSNAAGYITPGSDSVYVRWEQRPLVRETYTRLGGIQAKIRPERIQRTLIQACLRPSARPIPSSAAFRPTSTRRRPNGASTGARGSRVAPRFTTFPSAPTQSTTAMPRAILRPVRIRCM